MNENEKTHDQLLDTTDCLEAIGVFKAMKNLFFLISLICLIVLQGSFWLVDRNHVQSVGTDGCQGDVASVYLDFSLLSFSRSKAPVDPLAAEVVEQKTVSEAAAELTGQTPAVEEPAEITEPQKTETTEIQKVEEPAKKKIFRIKYSSLAWIIRLCNFVIIFSLTIYCLTMLFSLKISLLGRLGGINHITRAFFLSLFVLVFILPWQKMFGGILTGAMFTPDELLCWIGKKSDAGIIWTMLYYARFVGWWFFVLILLLGSYAKSCRWAKATLRRLGIA